MSIDGSYLRGVRRSWADGKVQRLENCLNKVIAGLIQASAVVKKERLEHERWKLECEENRRRREELRKQYKEEQEKLDRLLKQTQDWHKAREIRAFIDAVSLDGSLGTGSIVNDIETLEWKEWALEQADRFDPLVVSPPSVLDNIIEPYW